MSISHEKIFEGCRPILESVGFHNTSARHERRFLTGYQVYELLEEEGNLLCQELNDAVKGDYRGKGGGDHQRDGQVKRIAQALGGHPEVQTEYISTRHLRIDDIEPSSKEDCGIFRLRN